MYALAEGALADGEAVALFSYDEAAKAFVKEDAQASVSGGYAVFTAQEGKTYVVSSRDLTTEAKTIVTGGSSTMQGGSCCDPAPAAAAETMPSCCDTAKAAASQGDMPSCCENPAAHAVPPFAFVAAGVAVAAVVIAAIVAVVVLRRKRANAAAPSDASSQDGKDR